MTRNLTGTTDFQVAAVFRFAGEESIERKWAPPEYNAMVPVRNPGARMNAAILEDF